LIPQLLGGGTVVDLFLQSRNWPFGSAVAATLVVLMLVAVGVALHFTRGRGAERDVSLI
jgi:spermidine/putrescine transport system permease protein